MSSSVCVMAKMLRSEDLLHAFIDIPSTEETTTDKVESDADPRVDVDDADHDSQSEADISEDELSEYDETDEDDGNFYIGRDKQDGGKHKLHQGLRPEERIL